MFRNPDPVDNCGCDGKRVDSRLCRVEPEYLMRRNQITPWDGADEFIFRDKARLEKYKKEHDESNCMLDAGSKFLHESS